MTAPVFPAIFDFPLTRVEVLISAVAIHGFEHGWAPLSVLWWVGFSVYYSVLAGFGWCLWRIACGPYAALLVRVIVLEALLDTAFRAVRMAWLGWSL